MNAKASERRDGPRLDLQLRVRWHSEGGPESGEGEATDVSPRGARLENRTALPVGARLSFELDSGDGQAVHGTGEVTWCRPRQSPGGRTVYDLGVKFDDDWLKGERAPLARALSRFFASTDAEPARDFARMRTQLHGKGGAESVPLTIIDLSVGGVRVAAQGSSLPAGIKVGNSVRVSFGAPVDAHITATVAWVADAPDTGATVNAQFGLSFKDESAHRTVAAVMAALNHPDEAPTVTLEAE